MSGKNDGEWGSANRAQTLVVEAPSAQRAARSKAVLTTATGTQTARVFVIPSGEVVSLGRAEDANIRFDDASVSGNHARIVYVAGDYVFADNRSTNGSYINDVRVDSTTKLKDGDRIRLGPHCMLRFNIVDEDEEAALKKMYEAALYDGLTRVYNRKHFEERLDVELAFGARHNTELSIILLDVDYFKKVNDTYGHLAGDAVLRSTAQVMAHALRQEDLLARYGGEEFVVVARGINVQSAVVLADRLRVAVATTPVVFELQELRVTASAGVASLACCAGRADKATLIGLADQRLYAAKQAGRNRVIGP